MLAIDKGSSMLPMVVTTPHKSAEFIPSPGDPSMWEGASSLARFGLDIGGTLCKVVYFEPATESCNGELPAYVHGKDGCKNKIWESSHDPIHIAGRGTLYFKCFETWRMDEFLCLTKEYSLVKGERAIGATGGGARKFGSQFLEVAGLHLERADELKSLVKGIDFLARHGQQESFEYPKGCYKGGVIQRPWRSPDNSSESDHSEDEELPESQSKGPVPAQIESCANVAVYPYLVVNIGSGVSILKVDSADRFERVGGTSLGGSTFLGLSAALTGCNSFEDAIHLAAQGDSTEIDMLVGDIYGGDYSEMGLAATTVASSFGKLVHPANRAMAMQTPHHLAKATLLMVTNNIGSLAMLHAKTNNINLVMFTGSFLHGNKLAMRLLAVALEFWSKESIKAIFLRHEGHAGAVGALLSAMNPSDPVDSLLFG